MLKNNVFVLLTSVHLKNLKNSQKKNGTRNSTSAEDPEARVAIILPPPSTSAPFCVLFKLQGKERSRNKGLRTHNGWGSSMEHRTVTNSANPCSNLQTGLLLSQ